MANQGSSVSYIEPSTDAAQWDTYEPNSDGDSFIQSLLSSPGMDVLDYQNSSYCTNGASESSNESEAERQRREKTNLAARKSRAVKKERFAAMTGEIEQLHAENQHLRNVVQEMDSAIHEAKGVLMQANQLFSWAVR